MKDYLVVIEPTETGYSAYLPDLPGCITTGRTVEQIEERMREAIALHIEGLRRGGLPIPEPGTTATRIAVEA